MAVRTITGTVLRSNGSAWKGGEVRFRLADDTFTLTPDRSYPLDTVTAVADDTGTISVTLVSGLDKSYLVTMPDGQTFPIAVADGAPVTLEVLRASYSGVPVVVETVDAIASAIVADLAVLKTGSTMTGSLFAPLFDKGGQVYDVKAYGALGDGVADDTAALQAAINAVAAAPAGATVFIPPGTYRHTGLTANKQVMIQGAGIGATFLLNTHASNTSITMTLSGITAAVTTGAGVRDLTLCAGAIGSVAIGTNSGVGIHVTGANGDLYIEHVSIRNHGTGVRFTACFYAVLDHFTILANSGAGVRIDGDGASCYVSQGKISNFGCTGSNTSSIGIRWDRAGGFYADRVDTTVVNQGLVIQPTASETTAYGFFTNCLFDSSVSDNILIDGTNGFVVSVHFHDSWGAFSTNGSGIRILGANTDGIFWEGGRLRDNGLHGAKIEGGINLRFVGLEVARNSKATTLTGDGFNIAASVAEWAIIGCRIGNFASALTHQQRYGINAGASVDNYSIIGNDLRSNGTAATNGITAAATRKVFSNLPNTVNGTIAVDEGGTAATTAAGARTSLGAANIAGDTFTGSVAISNALPIFTLNETDQGADAKGWRTYVTGSTWVLDAINDAGSAANPAIQIIRSGALPTGIFLYSTVAGSAGIVSTSPSSGVGYATGAGGTVTQATSKATGVTLNKVCGQITMNAAALAAGTIVSFVLTNSAIAAGDVLALNHISGGTPGAYTLNARSAAGSATIDVRNNTAGSLSEAIVIAFAVIKAVTS